MGMAFTTNHALGDRVRLTDGANVSPQLQGIEICRDNGSQLVLPTFSDGEGYNDGIADPRYLFHLGLHLCQVDPFPADLDDIVRPAPQHESVIVV